MTAVLESPNGVAKGYLPEARPRYVWVTCDWTDGADDPDGEPFRADIRSNLPFPAIDAIGDPALTFEELWKVMAPYVRDWNALARNAETGEIVPAPPPAVAGWEAFRVIEADLTLWLQQQLRTTHLGGEHRAKKSPPPVSLADRPSGDDLA